MCYRWLILDDCLYHCGHSLNANGDHKISAITLISNPIKSRIKLYTSFEWRQAQSDTAVRNYSGISTQQVVIRRSHPAQYGETALVRQP